MLHGILEMSARNQVIVMTPFTLAGAMAPVTLAGALAEQNAEALAGMVLTQVVRPGAPVVYGGFTSNVDMQSGAPAFGTPEYMRTAMIGGQLARRYKRARIGRRTCRPRTRVDAQAAYESVFSLWGAIMGGVNLLMHGAGWMEGGLHAGFEKVILDAELLGMVEAFLDPVVVDDDTLALSAMEEVGPGGHFFGAARTRSRGSGRPSTSRCSRTGGTTRRGRRRARPRRPARRTHLEGAARRVRAAADRPGAPRGAGRVRRPPQGRGRRPDRLLASGLPMRADQEPRRVNIRRGSRRSAMRSPRSGSPLRGLSSPSQSRSPRPSTIGTTVTCMWSISRAVRKSRMTDAPPPIADVQSAGGLASPVRGPPPATCPGSGTSFRPPSRVGECG